jgi:hypothetical protein
MKLALAPQGRGRWTPTRFVRPRPYKPTRTLNPVRRLGYIGAEHTAWDDPQTPGDLLAAMVEGPPPEPRALTNGNMPPVCLLDFANEYPWLIEQNPALFLHKLHDPQYAFDITHELNLGWVESGLQLLPDAIRRELLFLFASRVISTYEAGDEGGSSWSAYPAGDPLARNILDLAVRIYKGEDAPVLLSDVAKVDTKGSRRFWMVDSKNQLVNGFWLTRKGSAGTVGTPGLAVGASNDVICVEAIDPATVNARYLYYQFMALQSAGFWKAKSKGTLALKHITVDQVKAIQIAGKGGLQVKLEQLIERARRILTPPPAGIACFSALTSAVEAARGNNFAAAAADESQFHLGKDLDESFKLELAEREFQANHIRAAYQEVQRYVYLASLARQAAQNAVAAVQAAENRRALTKKQIERAVKQANDSAAKIAELMQNPDVQTMPAWVGVGIMAVGALVVLTVGPEALAAAGVAGAAETIIGIAEAADVATVSVATIEEGAELAALVAKLRAAGLTVTTVAPAIVEMVKR